MIKQQFKYYPLFKRLFDLILALTLIILILPIMILVAVLIFIKSKEFPIFIQERGITLNNFRYKIIKFKTIKERKSVGLEDRLNNNIFYKPELTSELTKFSNWLRTTGIDELPQLLNVVIGNMSLIGPRPLMLSDLEIMKREYPGFYKKRGTFNSIPGISGLWQIYGERRKGMENLIKLEEDYKRNASLLFDLKLMIKTIPIIIFANHSDSISSNREIINTQQIKITDLN
ncbi:MAG: sugar transferase [Bacteroidetes bacterium]|nr:sugar transferase [Bacteroidota bacterium]